MIAPISPEEGTASSRFKTLKNNLRCSVGDGGCWGAMVGLGESYIPAFALAAGLGEVTAGWIASLPILAGGLLQTLSLRAIPLVGSYQRWIAISCTIQGLAFFPLVIAAATGFVSAPLLFFLASLYWGGGLAAGPAWNTWMGQIVPSTLRSSFFARRSRTNQLCTLSGFLLGGLILHSCKNDSQSLIGFAILFLLAGLFRLVSVLLLLKHRSHNPAHYFTSSKVQQSKEQPTARPQLIVHNPDDSGRCSKELDLSRGYRLVLFLAVVQGMVQFSGPYFTPYMLKHLSFSYAAFVSILSASFIAKAISMPLWGYLAQKRGARWLLWTGAISIVPLASLWNVSDAFFWLLMVQAASGTAWAAYELGFFLMFFDTLPNAKRTQMLTLYNLCNTSAWFCGSLLGGWYLSTSGATPAAYQTLFMVSTLGRCGALILLWNIDHPYSAQLRVLHSKLATSLAQLPAALPWNQSPQWVLSFATRRRTQQTATIPSSILTSPTALAAATIPTPAIHSNAISLDATTEEALQAA